MTLKLKKQAKQGGSNVSMNLLKSFIKHIAMTEKTKQFQILTFKIMRIVFQYYHYTNILNESIRQYAVFQCYVIL